MWASWWDGMSVHLGLETTLRQVPIDARGAEWHKDSGEHRFRTRLHTHVLMLRKRPDGWSQGTMAGNPPPCICLWGNLPISGHRNLASSLSLCARHAESSLLISTSERCNRDQTHSEPRVLVSSALVLLRLSLCWSPHDRPLVQRWVVGVRNNDFTQKGSSLRRQQAMAPKEPSCLS